NRAYNRRHRAVDDSSAPIAVGLQEGVGNTGDLVVVRQPVRHGDALDIIRFHRSK
ncbi:unnamed protein product, partial [Musa textilis]